MKNRKIKRCLSILLSTLFLTANFSNIQSANAASLSLKSAVNSNGSVKLTVSGGSSGSSYRFYVYKDGTWQTISAYNYESQTAKVNVLNIYPTNDGDGNSLGTTQKDSLSVYMNKHGKGKINVIPVSMTDFNASPCDYLYQNNGTWYTKGGKQLDVIYFGSYDGYGKHNDISNIAKSGSDDLGSGYSPVVRVLMYIKDNGSVLFGHDCVFPQADNFWNYFHDTLGLTEKSGLLTNISTDTEGNRYPDSTNIKYRCPINITKNNSTTMMTMPNILSASGLTTFYTHSTNCAVKKDNVFVEFTPTNGSSFYNLKATSTSLTESSTADPTRNFYIAGNGTGHVFQTQVGHNKGKMSDDEAKLLANMFFYLKQTTTETFDYYYDAEDKAAPNAPSINKSLNGDNFKFSFSATDNGTQYKFKVDNISSSGTTSATATCSYATGVDHYIYKVDSSSSTSIKSGSSSSGSTSLSLSTVTNKYLHVAAVDKAGNVGPTSTIYVETKPDLTISSMSIKNSAGYTTSSFYGKETAEVTVTVKNQGIADADSCYLKVNGPFVNGYKEVYIPTLEAGETYSKTISAEIANRDTTSTISAYVDCYDSIDESNENNNSYSKTIYVTEKNPDLIITSLNTYKNGELNTRFKPGDKAEIKAVVKNSGNDYASTFNVKISGPLGTFEEEINGLNAGSSQTIIISDIEVPETPLGINSLTAFADSNYDVEELDETNNKYSKNIEINYPYPILNSTDIQGYKYLKGNNYWFSLNDSIEISQKYSSSDTETNLDGQDIYLSAEDKDVASINFRANTEETESSFDEDTFEEIESQKTSEDTNANWQGYVKIKPKTEGKFLYNTSAFLQYGEETTYYNNQEKNSTNKYINIDGTAPEITVSQSPTTWTNGNVIIKSSATDLNGSGVKNISINNNVSTSTSKSYTATKNGEYKVTSEDNVGNIKEETVVITNIDKLQPIINSVKYKIIEENGNALKVKVIIDTKDADETDDYGTSGLKTVIAVVNGTQYIAQLNEETGKYEAEVNITKGSIATITTKVTDNANNVTSKTDKCDDGIITTNATVENYNYLDSSKNIYWVNAETKPLIKTVFNMSANYYEKFIANEDIVVKKSTNGIYNGTYNNIAEIYNNHDDNGALINQNKCSAVTDCANEDIIGDTDISGDAMVSRNINFALNLKDDTFYKVQAYYNDSVQDITDKYSNTTYPFIIGYDSIKPSTEYTKSTENWTNGNVSVTYKYSDKGSGIKAFTINNVNQSKNSVSGSTSKTYTTNGIYKYKVEDNVGNITEDDIEITNIDKLQPFISSLDCVRNEDGTTRVYIGAFDALATDQYGCSGVKDVYVNSTGAYQKATLDKALNSYYCVITTPTNKVDKTITIKVVDNAGNTKIETKVIKQPQLTTSATVENYNYFDISKNIYWVNAETNPLVNAQFNLTENTYNEHIANINLAVMQNAVNKAEAYNNYQSDDIEINEDKCTATFDENTASEKKDIINQENTSIDGDSKSQRNLKLSLDFKEDGLYTIKPYFNMLEMENEYQNANTTNGEYNFTLGYDSTKPATKYDYSETEWTNKDVTVTYQYEDNGSGIKSVKVDSTNQTLSGNKTITKTYSTNGVHLYEASDNVDNTTTDYVEISNIDKLEPIIDPHIEVLPNSTTTKLIIAAEDAKETTENGCSGIKNVQITINNTTVTAQYNENTKKYEAQIPTSDTDTNNFIIKVTDNAGNNVSLAQSLASDLTITNLEGKNEEEISNSGNVLATGFNYTLVIGSNYRLYSWGNNDNGQLGNGTTTNKTTPTKITTNLDLQQIASGYYHALAIGDDSNLYSWGNNTDGQLGNGTTTTKTSPTKITLASGVKPKAISANGNNSMAIGTNNQLYVWGNNYSGQIGDGTTTNRKSPTKITLASNITPIEIASGYQHSMAIGSDGKLYAWGDNSYGQLGIGKNAEDSSSSSSTDTVAENTTTNYYISSSTNFDLRGDYNGSVVKTTFSNNGYSTVFKVGSSSVNVTGMKDTTLDLVTISTKIDIINNNHYAKITYIIKNNSTVEKTIGVATHCDTQIGSNDGAPIEKTTDGKGFTMTGSPYVYRFIGKNNYGVTDVDTYWFGNYSNRTSNMWNQVTSNSYSGDSGFAYSWQNRNIKAGETKMYSVLIGIGSLKNPTQNTPKIVTTENNNGNEEIFKPISISAGNYHSMAIGDDGELYTWGENSYGQLGTGDKTTVYKPTKVTLANGIKPKTISAGGSYSMAIGEDGELYTWGDNSYGQLGIGNTQVKLIPTKVTLATGVKPVSILAGQNGHSMAIGSDGNLYVWGYNDNYQLGLGNTINVTKPVRINLAAGVKPFAKTISDDATSRMKAVQTRDEYTINGTVANIDKLTNAPCKLTVTYEDGTVVGSVDIPSIEENGEYKFSLKAIAPSKEGIYTLYAKVDSEDIIQESNENNNIATMQIVVSNSPADLTVSGLSIKHNNTEINSSKSGYHDTISGLILNIGDSPSTSCKGQIVDQNGTIISNLDIPELQPDSSYAFTEAFTEPLESGIYELTVIADVEDTVIERNENNNSKSITVNVVGLPDLQVNNLKVATTNNKYVLNTKYELTGTIVNKGHGSAAASVARITDNTGKTLGTINVPELQNNEEYNFKLEFTTPPIKGDYTIKVYTDYNNKVEETDETNNEGSITINVKSRLEILGLSCIKRTIGIGNVDSTKVNGPVTDPLEILTNAENTLQLDCSGAKIAELSFYVGNTKINNIKFKDTNAKKFVNYDGTLYKYDETKIKDGDNETDNKVAMITNDPEEESLKVTFVLPKDVKDGTIISVKIVLYDDDGNMINNELGNNFFVVKGNLQKKWNINNIR